MEAKAMGSFARFVKCALQVNPHSYAKSYQSLEHGLSEDDFNFQLALKCKANDIEVVGVADHGCVASLDKLRNVLEAEGIIVLPGFEIASTEKVHMVCLYPSGTEATKLNQYLGALGLPAGGNATAASRFGCVEIASLIFQQGGFWFAAHATNANGLLRLNKDGGGLTHIWRNCEAVRAVQIPADIESLDIGVRRIIENKDPAYGRIRPVAVINAKDVCKPENLDDPRSWSWFKMSAPTLEAISLACLDPQSRVRLSHQINPSFYSWIEKVTVSRGYLEDLNLALSPNLNTIVGGRGTGKSTLIEAIRFVFDVEPLGNDARRVHKSVLEGNFAKEKAGISVVVTSFEQNSERYTVSRYFGEKPKVLDEDGSLTDLSPQDVLPGIEVYGQNELLAIVQDDQALAHLMGRFLDYDDREDDEIAEVLKSLAANRASLNDKEARLSDLDDRLAALPALMDKKKSFEKLGLKQQLSEVEHRESVRAYAAHARKTGGRYGKLVSEFEKSVLSVHNPELPEPNDGPYTNHLEKIAKNLESQRSVLIDAIAMMKTAIDKKAGDFNALASSADLAISKAEQAFNVEIDKLPTLQGKSVAQLSTEFAKTTAEINRLKPLKKVRSALFAEIETSQKERTGLVEKLAEVRNAKWTSLSKAVKKLNKKLDGYLKVDFEPERIRDPLKSYLLGCELEGVGEKRLSWVDQTPVISVASLASAIRAGAKTLQEMFSEYGMTPGTSTVLANMSVDDLRGLEEVELPERVDLLLNVSQGVPNYRPVKRLSTGQQCTAILHLLLLDNRDPLIIDQPEDNLDNSFIAGHIVNQLRTSKTDRQFLFATHNANIPVFGDAEWIGVLQEEDGHGVIQASGSIDSDQIKALAANILEGGKEAFTRRKEKYNF